MPLQPDPVSLYGHMCASVNAALFQYFGKFSAGPLSIVVVLLLNLNLLRILINQVAICVRNLSQILNTGIQNNSLFS